MSYTGTLIPDKFLLNKPDMPLLQMHSLFMLVGYPAASTQTDSRTPEHETTAQAVCKLEPAAVLLASPLLNKTL